MCRGHKIFWGTIPYFFSPKMGRFFTGTITSSKMWAERQKCGQSFCKDITIFTIICTEAHYKSLSLQKPFVKNVGRSSEMWADLPTFLTKWPNWPPLPGKKTCFSGVKKSELPQLFRCGTVTCIIGIFLKKNWQELVSPTLSNGEKNLPPPIWGCHHQLYNHHR